MRLEVSQHRRPHPLCGHDLITATSHAISNDSVFITDWNRSETFSLCSLLRYVRSTKGTDGNSGGATGRVRTFENTRAC